MAQQDERPATLSKLVGKQIKLQLFLKEMSGRDLAGKLGVSPSWVSYRTSGKQEIGLDDLMAIANVLGVDLDQLLTEDVIAKAKDSTEEGANQDFDLAPADATATVGHSFVGMPKGVSRPPKPKGRPRPNGRPKPGTARPTSPVPPRLRRPAAVAS